MDLIEQAKDIQSQIDVTFRTAYAALQKANMEIGISYVQEISRTVPVENSISIKHEALWVRKFLWCVLNRLLMSHLFLLWNKGFS